MDNFNRILNEVVGTGNFTLSQLEELDKLYGNRFWKALELAIHNKVKKYKFNPSNRIIWIIASENRDYFTLDNYYCNCKDFFIRIVSRRESNFCKHLLAKSLSLALNHYEVIEIEDDRYNQLMEEWREF